MVLVPLLVNRVVRAQVGVALLPEWAESVGEGSGARLLK